MERGNTGMGGGGGNWQEHPNIIQIILVGCRSRQTMKHLFVSTNFPRVFAVRSILSIGSTRETSSEGGVVRVLHRFPERAEPWRR